MSGTFLGIDVSDPVFVPQTAWLGHGPFASWLIRASEPACVVELGTHHGYSYFSFCQAVAAAKLKTRCFAVDTWKGDKHAGFYDDSIFDKVSTENEKYRTFSKLIRKTFLEALSEIENGSVDLLHIDGRHFYDDVKEDFENWIPKLSTRAIVLFHDTEVQERGFGVWRYWAEISKTRPSLNFIHQHGLGVLFWGDNIPQGVIPLLDLLTLPEGRQATLDFFALQGYSIEHQRSALQHNRETAQELQKLTQQLVISVMRTNDLHMQVNKLETRLETFQELLKDARTKPLKMLYHKFIFKILQIISNSRLPLPTGMAEHLSISKEKRDPRRQEIS